MQLIRYELSDVPHLNGVFSFVCQSVSEHQLAEGAGGGDRAAAGGGQFFDAVVVDAGTDGFFGEECGAACAAAEGSLPIPCCLDGADSGGVQILAGQVTILFSQVSAQVTCVMIYRFPFVFRRDAKPALCEEVVDEFRVVGQCDFRFQSHVAILGQGAQTMRTSGDDLGW